MKYGLQRPKRVSQFDIDKYTYSENDQEYKNGRKIGGIVVYF